MSTIGFAERYAGGLGGAEIIEIVRDLMEFLRADDEVHVRQLVE